MVLYCIWLPLSTGQSILHVNLFQVVCFSFTWHHLCFLLLYLPQNLKQGLNPLLFFFDHPKTFSFPVYCGTQAHIKKIGPKMENQDRKANTESPSLIPGMCCEVDKRLEICQYSNSRVKRRSTQKTKIPSFFPDNRDLKCSQLEKYVLKTLENIKRLPITTRHSTK